MVLRLPSHSVFSIVPAWKTLVHMQQFESEMDRLKVRWICDKSRRIHYFTRTESMAPDSSRGTSEWVEAALQDLELLQNQAHTMNDDTSPFLMCGPLGRFSINSGFLLGLIHDTCLILMQNIQNTFSHQPHSLPVRHLVDSGALPAQARVCKYMI